LAVLRDAELPQFGTHLDERQAFKGVLAHRLSLDELDAGQVSGVAEAIANADKLADVLIPAEAETCPIIPLDSGSAAACPIRLAP
jgi:hypothetical protein